MNDYNVLQIKFIVSKKETIIPDLHSVLVIPLVMKKRDQIISFVNMYTHSTPIENTIAGVVYPNNERNIS